MACWYVDTSAAALTLGDDLAGVVTSDDRLADAARQVGVMVATPT